MNCSKHPCTKGAVTVLPAGPRRVVGTCEEHEDELLAELLLVERTATCFYQGRPIPESRVVPLPSLDEIEVLTDDLRREKNARGKRKDP